MSAFSAPKLFFLLDHTESYVEKIHCADAELAMHAHKLDVKVEVIACLNNFSLNRSTKYL